MPIHLTDSLLALAASIDGDGGRAVCRTLASLLRDTAPFEAGEVVLRQKNGFHRFPFGVDERPVVGDDVVAQVLASGASVRLDDPRDLGAFPETRDRMEESGFKSALILPLGTVLHVPNPPHGASPNGVLALSRRHGWAFVGASLNFLGPLAAMAGLALDRALALTALGHPAGTEIGTNIDVRDALRQEGATLISELRQLREASAVSGGEVEALRSSLAAVRDELAGTRGAAIAAQAALDQAVGRCHTLEAELERARSASPGAGSEGESIGRAAAEGSTPEAVSLQASLPGVASRGSRRRRRGAFEPSGSR